MKKNRFDVLSEVKAATDRGPYEEQDLRRRTDFQSRAPRSGADFKAMALARLQEAGATIERKNFEIEGFPVDAQIFGSNGRRFLVLARGTPEEQDRGALRRTDTVEKMGFMAMQLARHQNMPILVITSDLPRRSTKAGHYLAALSPDVWDVVSHRADLRGFHRVSEHLHGSVDLAPPDAPWRRPWKTPQQSLFDEVTSTSDHLARPSERDPMSPEVAPVDPP